jgi:hypothetical protein
LVGYLYAALSRVGQPTCLKVFVKIATAVQSLRCVWGVGGVCDVVVQMRILPPVRMQLTMIVITTMSIFDSSCAHGITSNPLNTILKLSTFNL